MTELVLNLVKIRSCKFRMQKLPWSRISTMESMLKNIIIDILKIQNKEIFLKAIRENNLLNVGNTDFNDNRVLICNFGIQSR
jgi:hypothetical protein